MQSIQFTSLIDAKVTSLFDLLLPMPTYTPPFTPTPSIQRRVDSISAQVSRLQADAREGEAALRLRRVNRVRTIQGSLAIEGNTLSTEHITAILEGKRVIAPVREVQEVRNAIAVYECLPDYLPHRRADMLAAHGVLMLGLLDRMGGFRSTGVGVMAGEGANQRVIHMAPPASRVSELMNDLLAWLKRTEVHPLIASSIFHYEFEFIHPFLDGNGRMGRLWQTLILSRWHPIFLDVPVESLVYAHQKEYYEAIAQSNAQSNSTLFVEFMLGMIEQALLTPDAQFTPQVTPQVKALMAVCIGQMSRAELQRALGLADRKNFVARYLNPALQAGVIEMTLPDAPNSRMQKYQLKQAR